MRKVLILLCIFILNGVANAQSVTPEITSFSAGLERLDRNALAERSVRVPVSWATAVRPITANLFFEQVLPDGSAINVELPRLIPWVASSGQGWAAPILPMPDLGEVVLRVRLVDLLSSYIYSERQLTIPISTVPGQRANFGNMPTISRFMTCCPSVSSSDLISRNARVPVTWQAINRPLTANLVFEQVLSDGSVVNIELPRSVPWVASSGGGVTAPIWPGQSPANILLRVRLVDLLNRRVYDQRELTATITDSIPTPSIRFFTTTATNVSRRDLNIRMARINVTWAVDNRPPNSNLFFEQVLADGSVRNVELPRDNPIIASSGNGVVAPFAPVGTASEILLRVRLADVLGNTTITAREIRLPILKDAGTSGFVVYDPAQCFNGPFPASYGFSVGGHGRVSPMTSGHLTLTSITGDLRGAEGAGAIADLTGGERFVVTGGPYCYHREGEAAQRTFREWRIHLDGNNLEGWLREYDQQGSQIMYFIEVVADQPGGIMINSFTASPNPVERGGTITLTWDVYGATSLGITRLSEQGDIYLESIIEPSSGTGSMTYTVPADYINSISFILLTNNPATNQKLVVDLVCPFAQSLVVDDCPITQTTIEAAYQPFQNGYMIWRADNREIYVLYIGGQYETYPDTWIVSEGYSHGQLPPDDFIEPERGFGKVWVTQPGVRDRLGWAIAPEVSYSTTLETHRDMFGHYPYDSIHFLLPDGRVTHLDGSGGWQME